MNLPGFRKKLSWTLLPACVAFACTEPGAYQPVKGEMPDQAARETSQDLSASSDKNSGQQAPQREITVLPPATDLKKSEKPEGNFETDCQHGHFSRLRISGEDLNWEELWHLDAGCKLPSVTYRAAYKMKFTAKKPGLWQADFMWRSSYIQVHHRIMDPASFGEYTCAGNERLLKQGKEAETTACQHYRNFFTVLELSEGGIRVGLPENNTAGTSSADRSQTLSADLWKRSSGNPN